MKKETTFGKVVNFDETTGEITVLDSIFEYEDGFKGATGSIFIAVSASEYEEATGEDDVIDHIVALGVPEAFVRTGAKGCYDKMLDRGEIRDFTFDCSYEDLWPYLREELGLTKDDAFIFNCIGGGRCFDAEFDGNVNQELSEIIRSYEK